jgi:hypothetical protein
MWKQWLALLILLTAGNVVAPTVQGQTVRVVDPLAVRADGDAAQAVVSVPMPTTAAEEKCDVVILGGGLGGSAAALTAASQGARVCMTEPTNWLGGQMTSQGISAFDDNEWIETTGATRTFKLLRQRIREHYAPMLRAGVKPDSSLNPGLCWVSYQCSEADVDRAVLQSMLGPLVQNGKLAIYLRSSPVAVERNGDGIRSVTTYNFETHGFLRLTGKVFVDATELGEFLPLAGVHFVTGAESRSETGEADAPAKADPEAAQSFTYAFVLEQTLAAHEHRKPVGYERYASQFSFRSTDADGKTLAYGMYAQLPDTPGAFWTYRRLIAKEQFKAGRFASDLSMINWDSNDVCDVKLLSEDPLEEAAALQHGKQVSQAFAWWLQNEVPRDDGKGGGYPELRVVDSALGSADGLSQFPYIRESRRIQGLHTIHEQDLATKGARAIPFEDSVGIGQYPIDIHACGASPHLPASKPYQIPLGALIAGDVSNLLAASKNIGTTHITNGAYRVHPTEWAIGVAAGFVAAQAVKDGVAPRRIDGSAERLRRLQWALVSEGQPLVWFDDLPLDAPYFKSAQFAAILGLQNLREDSLHFGAQEAVSGQEAIDAINKLRKLRTVPEFPGEVDIAGQKSIDWSSLASLGVATERTHGVVKRGEFADWLIECYFSCAVQKQ